MTLFKWRHVEIDVAGGFAIWSIDGLPLGKVDLSTVTLGGGNIFLGHSDTNNGSSADANDTLLNVTLIDNGVSGDGMAIALPKDDPQLKADVNNALAEVRTSGRFIELVTRYFPFRLY